MANHVVHFEIIGTDAPALREFYGKAFDWQLETIGGPAEDALVRNAGIGGGIGSCPAEYALVRNAGIGGGIGSCPNGAEGHVTFYVAVDDIKNALAKVETLGATNLQGPWPIPTGGSIATFEDPQGQMVGLVQGP